jgi:hypothetical protein
MVCVWLENKMSLITFLKICALILWEICTVWCRRCVMVCTKGRWISCWIYISGVKHNGLLSFSSNSSWLYEWLGTVYHHITLLFASVEVLIRRWAEKWSMKYTQWSVVCMCVFYCFPECRVPKFSFTHNGINGFLFHGTVWNMNSNVYSVWCNLQNDGKWFPFSLIYTALCSSHPNI